MSTDTPLSLAAANRENTRELLKREIAFCQAEAARLRRECYALRLKADQFDIDADRFQRQLDALGPATLGVLA